MIIFNAIHKVDCLVPYKGWNAPNEHLIVQQNSEECISDRYQKCLTSVFESFMKHIHGHRIINKPHYLKIFVLVFFRSLGELWKIAKGRRKESLERSSALVDYFNSVRWVETAGVCWVEDYYRLASIVVSPLADDPADSYVVVEVRVDRVGEVVGSCEC